MTLIRKKQNPEPQRGRAATKNTHHGGTETRRRLKAKVKIKISTQRTQRNSEVAEG
jgi:hypothetical protein